MNAMKWLLPALAITACQGHGVRHESTPLEIVTAIPHEKLTRLAGKHVYFGHQSVGYNIVEGLQSIARERPDLALRIVEGRTPEALAKPGFAHASNGRNHEPLTKISDFAETLERGGLGARTNIALFKFCYVDFPPGTDVRAVFEEYKRTLIHLRQAFPGVKFVHVTSPLTVVQAGPKALVKRMLGRPLGGADANMTREHFNALLRDEYAGREPLFDLAAVESTRPDRTVVSFQGEGKSYPALSHEFTTDGKHLNELGARWVAAHLLETLASLED